MIRKLQRQHKAHINSLKTPTISEAVKNVKFEKVPQEGRDQLQWRSKKEVERANSKTEGEEDHVPPNLYPGKYKISSRA